MLALTNAHGKNDGDTFHQHVLHELAWIEYGLWLLWLNVSLDEKIPQNKDVMRAGVPLLATSRYFL